MFRAFYLVVIWVLTASVLPADTIRVGDKYHRDVYIRVSSDYYYIYHPEEGRHERVSRRRSDISEPRIDEDETVRVLKIKKRKKNLAEFESQLAHWRELDSEAQEAILVGLQMTLLKRSELREVGHANAVGDLEALDVKKATVESQLDAAAQARADAVRQAQAEDSADYYLDEYENSRVLVGPVYHYYYDDYGNIRVAPTWWYDQDESLYAQAQAERERTRRRIDAAEATYGARAETYGNELQSVQKSISQRERDARAVVSKAYDEQRRYGAWQARIGALMEATAGDYEPRVQANPVQTWAGSGNRRTDSFRVDEGLWRIDCRLIEAVASENFSVTVYDADTDVPFTRIAGADFLGMRMRIFDKPGNYYLVVDQGVLDVAYEISVSTLILK